MTDNFVDIEDRESHKALVKTLVVATCFVCRGRCAKRRAKLDSAMVMCPDCGHALYWERVNPNHEQTNRRGERKDDKA